MRKDAPTTISVTYSTPTLGSCVRCCSMGCWCRRGCSTAPISSCISRGTGHQPIFNTTRSSRSTCVLRLGCEAGLPALAEPQAEDAPVGVGIFLVVADADDLVVEEGRVDVEHVARVELDPRAPQPRAEVLGNIVAELYVDGGPGIDSARRSAGDIVVAVGKIRGHLRCEPGELP